MLKRLIGLIFIIILGCVFVLSGPTISYEKVAKEVVNYEMEKIKEGKPFLERSFLGIVGSMNADEMTNDITKLLEREGAQKEVRGIFENYKGKRVLVTEVLTYEGYALKSKPGILSGIRNGAYIIYKPLVETFMTFNAYLSKYEFYPSKLRVSIENTVPDEKLKEIRERGVLKGLGKVMNSIWVSLKLAITLFFIGGSILYYPVYLISLIIWFAIFLLPFMPRSEVE